MKPEPTPEDLLEFEIEGEDTDSFINKLDGAIVLALIPRPFLFCVPVVVVEDRGDDEEEVVVDDDDILPKRRS